MLFRDFRFPEGERASAWNGERFKFFRVLEDVSNAVTYFGNPYSLALTGGIACGKSTVAALLEQSGLLRVDSDQIARQVVAPGTPGLAAIVARFGSEVLQPDGSLDRQAMGRRVFGDAQARRDLERIVHPLIWVSLEESMKNAADQHRETVFEIPLLFENGNEGRFSTVWVVSAEPELQLLRLRERDGLSDAEARARIESQMSVEEKARRAGYVIRNSGHFEDLRAQVARGLAQWRQARGAGQPA